MARWRSGHVAWMLAGAGELSRSPACGVLTDAIDCPCEETLPFPCDEGKPVCVLANLDLQNLKLLVLSDLLHLIYEAVGELL